MKKLLLLTLLLVKTTYAGNQNTREIRSVNTDSFTAFSSIVRNPGFERRAREWTAPGGTFTTTTTSADVGSGSRAGSWDSNASSQTLTSTAIAIPSGDYGANYEVSANLKCATGTCTHTIQAYDGTNIVASQTITSSNTYVRSTLNFVAPSSGNLSARIVSVASDEPILYVDDVYLGRARNIGSVAQAQLVGTLNYAPATNCRWQLTSSGFSNFSADTDCSTPTVTGSLSAPGTKIPAFVINNAQPGNYQVFAKYMPSNGGGAIACSWRISDGTNTGYPLGNNAVSGPPTTYQGSISLTSAQATWTVNLQARGDGVNSCDIIANGTTAPSNDLTFEVYRFPTTPETAYRPELLANSWSGYHDTDCQWTTTSSSFADPTADSTCTFAESTNSNFGTVTSYLSGSDKLPGIVFTPKRVQDYAVCVGTSTRNTASNQNSIELSDLVPTVVGLNAMNSPGVTNDFHQSVCGIYNATDTSSKTLRVRVKTSGGTLTMNGTSVGRVQWTIYAINQSIPAPVLVGSVTAKYAGAGVAGWVSFGGASERSQCTSTPCTIYDQSGTTSNFISSVTRASTGNYTINFVSGVFTRAPYLICYDAQGNSNTSFMTTNGSAPTTTAFGLIFSNYNVPGNRDTQADCLILGR